MLRGPAVAVLAADNRPLFADARVLDVLRELADDPRLPSGLPTSLEAVAERARWAAGRERPGHPTAVCVCAPGGQWLTLDASALEARPDGHVAVMIAPAAAGDVLATALLAFAFSPRERAVVSLVVRGLSTQEIARALALAPGTVQDYLKSVFGKAGVRSRRELVALLVPHRPGAPDDAAG